MRLRIPLCGNYSRVVGKTQMVNDFFSFFPCLLRNQPTRIPQVG